MVRSRQFHGMDWSFGVLRGLVSVEKVGRREETYWLRALGRCRRSRLGPRWMEESIWAAAVVPQPEEREVVEECVDMMSGPRNRKPRGVCKSVDQEDSRQSST